MLTPLVIDGQTDSGSPLSVFRCPLAHDGSRIADSGKRSAVNGGHEFVTSDVTVVRYHRQKRAATSPASRRG
jgi:hypothetical protein